jgi:tRNA(Ile)-lysidine synthase
MTFLANSIKNFFTHLSISHDSLQTLWVAYSGGVDSQVLLYVLTQLKSDLPYAIKAIHINHNIHMNSKLWAQHCDSICNHLGVDLEIRSIDIIRKSGQSLEELARNERYKMFQSTMHDNDCLLTAHHLEDQAETCMLQFLRGAGAKGMAAMPNMTKFGVGYLGRPLLNVSKHDILKFAAEHNMAWIEDDSNHDLSFTRNFLRHKIMPDLRKRWPSIDRTIKRVASHSAEADELLQDLAKLDLQIVAQNNDESLDVLLLKKYSYARQKNILRQWIETKNVILPTAKKLNAIISSVVYARCDANPVVKWGNVSVRRFKNRLWLVQDAFASFDHTQLYDLTAVIKAMLSGAKNSSILSIAGLGDIALNVETRFVKFHDSKQERQYLDIKTPLIKPHKSIGIDLQKLASASSVELRFRQGGELCRLPKRTATHKLKKLLQEFGVPPWERAKVPLLYVDGKLAQIVGFGVCASFSAN